MNLFSITVPFSYIEINKVSHTPQEMFHHIPLNLRGDETSNRLLFVYAIVIIQEQVDWNGCLSMAL